MDPFYSFLNLKCFSCKESLIRIAESETNDRVICPSCFAVGEYEQVVEQGSGLSVGYPVSEEVKNFFTKLSVRRDRML